MPTLEDRLFPQALRRGLAPIFEADFLPCSHGFRQGHSPHTARRDVARMYPRVSWVIEGAIGGCVDNIPHHGLLKAGARRIADGKVLSLVSALLRAGYMENWQYHRPYSGTPPGGISSPLLGNLFLHQLEAYRDSLGANRVQTKREAHLRRSPAYRPRDTAIQRARAQRRNNPDRRARSALLATLAGLEKAMRQPPLYAARPLTTLGYVRSAEDFVILVNGPEQEARDVQRTVEGHLGAMGLTLSAEKTKVTPWSMPSVFLGSSIHGALRAQGVHIKALLSIPKETERLLRRELLHIASPPHIPELDAMILMNATCRGWCHSDK